MIPPEPPRPLGETLADGRVYASEADVLAHIIEYGERCRNMEAQLRAWIALATSWRAGVPAGRAPETDPAPQQQPSAAKEER